MGLELTATCILLSASIRLNHLLMARLASFSISLLASVALTPFSLAASVPTALNKRDTGCATYTGPMYTFDLDVPPNKYYLNVTAPWLPYQNFIPVSTKAGPAMFQIHHCADTDIVDIICTVRISHF